VRLLQKRLWNGALRRYLATRTTDGFTSFEEFFDCLTQGMIDRRRFRTLEAMVHPGHPQLGAETALLSSEWFAKNDIRLISYNDV
jgi:hypothetical protein